MIGIKVLLISVVVSILTFTQTPKRKIYVSKEMFTTMVFNAAPVIISDTTNAHKTVSIRIEGNRLMVAAAYRGIKDYPILVRAGKMEFDLQMRYSEKVKILLFDFSK